MNESPVNLSFYALRERGEEELFPWDFIKGNISKDRLTKGPGGAGKAITYQIFYLLRIQIQIYS